MKRFWFGAALLALFLAGGLLLAGGSHSIYGPVREHLEAASEEALQEDWSAAGSRFREAKHLWEAQWHFVASITDHAPMEEIDALFSQAELHAQRQNTTLFTDTCAQLDSQLEDLIEAQLPTWWNIL